MRVLRPSWDLPGNNCVGYDRRRISLGRLACSIASFDEPCVVLSYAIWFIQDGFDDAILEHLQIIGQWRIIAKLYPDFYNQHFRGASVYVEETLRPAAASVMVLSGNKRPWFSCCGVLLDGGAA